MIIFMLVGLFNSVWLFAGLELLLGLLVSTSLKQQLDGSVALYKLANKALALSPVDAAPLSPTPQVHVVSNALICFALFNLS